MGLEEFIDELKKLGYSVTRQGKAKLKEGVKYVILFNRGDIGFTLITEMDTTEKIFQSTIEDKEVGETINLTKNGINTYNLLRIYLSNSDRVLKGEDEEEITKGLNTVYEDVGGTNKVEIEYSKGEISFKGVTSEDILRNALEGRLEDAIYGKGLVGNVGLYFLVKKSEIVNKTSVSDIEDFLKTVKLYISRVGAGNKKDSLEEIYETIKDKLTHYDTPESIVKRVYDFPILGEEYDTPDSEEVIYERVTDTAKKIRKRLKKEFKNTKFSVKSYNENKIDVRWTDYPTKDEVQKVVNLYNGYHSQQTYGDYGADRIDVGYIDPEDKKRYTSPRFLFCELEYSDKMRDLLFYFVGEHMVSAYGIDSEDYKQGRLRQSITVKMTERDDKFKNISSEDDIDNLYIQSKIKFETNFEDRIKRDIKKIIDTDFKLDVKHLRVEEGIVASSPVILIQLQESDREKLKNELSKHPVLRGYSAEVTYQSTTKINQESKVKKFRESIDKKDDIRLKRFAGYLTEHKIKSRVGTNLKLPTYIVVEVGGVSLSFAPTFVVYLDSKKLIYDKHSEELDYKVLERSIKKLIESGAVKTKSGAETVLKVVQAYMKSNDLRRKM